MESSLSLTCIRRLLRDQALTVRGVFLVLLGRHFNTYELRHGDTVALGATRTCNLYAERRQLLKIGMKPSEKDVTFLRADSIQFH